jgi:hypothetical protein
MKKQLLISTLITVSSAFGMKEQNDKSLASLEKATTQLNTITNLCWKARMFGVGKWCENLESGKIELQQTRDAYNRLTPATKAQLKASTQTIAEKHQLQRIQPPAFLNYFDPTTRCYKTKPADDKEFDKFTAQSGRAFLDVASNHLSCLEQQKGRHQCAAETAYVLNRLEKIFKSNSSNSN